MADDRNRSARPRGAGRCVAAAADDAVCPCRCIRVCAIVAAPPRLATRSSCVWRFDYQLASPWGHWAIGKNCGRGDDGRDVCAFCRTYTAALAADRAGYSAQRMCVVCSIQTTASRSINPGNAAFDLYWRWLQRWWEQGCESEPGSSKHTMAFKREHLWQ